MESVNETLGKITEFLRSELKTESLIGQQFQLGEFTCVPVIAAGFGFGSGAGADKNAGKTENGATSTGAGAGMGISPVGFLVTRGADIQFISTKHSSLDALVEKAPELVAILADLKKKEKSN